MKPNRVQRGAAAAQIIAVLLFLILASYFVVKGVKSSISETFAPNQLSAPAQVNGVSTYSLETLTTVSQTRALIGAAMAFVLSSVILSFTIRSSKFHDIDTGKKFCIISSTLSIMGGGAALVSGLLMQSYGDNFGLALCGVSILMIIFGVYGFVNPDPND